jgi:CO/xanthine dehydrogenase FAD-binding subunit
MLPNFSNHRVASKEEALSCLSSLESARVMAGGTDLIVQMRRGAACDHIVDVTAIPGLDRIEDRGDRFLIGATTTHGSIAGSRSLSEYAASLTAACRSVGSPQIRNMGTIGGNLVNASPAADSFPPLLIHDATLLLESKKGAREESLASFVLGPYKTSIEKDELLTGIRIRGLKGYREGYRRVTRRAAWAISRLSVAWAIEEEEGGFGDVRLAIGSCTPMPLRLGGVEDFLRGNRKNEDTIANAVDMVVAEIRRISGERPSFVYKIPALKGILERVLRG